MQKTRRGHCARKGPSQSLWKSPLNFEFWIPGTRGSYREAIRWGEENAMGANQDFGFIISPPQHSLKRKCSWCFHRNPPQISEDVCHSPAALATSAVQSGEHQPAHTGSPQFTWRSLGTQVIGTPWLHEMATFNSSFSSSSEWWPWEKRHLPAICTCLWALKCSMANTLASTQL